MIENRVPGYVYNELFIKSNEEKCTALQRIVWSFIVHKNTIKAAQLLCKYFLPGLSLYTLYFFFHKCKDSSVVPQPSVKHFIYVFRIFFRFHKCFNNFYLCKNILINTFFLLKHVFLYSFTSMAQGSCRFLFEVKHKGVVGFPLK